MKLKIIIPILCALISSCSKSNKILENQNFDEGEWMLVNVNYVDKTLELLDNKLILESSKSSIFVLPGGDCGATTCDGFVMLYKDGKLVEEIGYLSRNFLYESELIKKSYEIGVESYIEPINSDDFNKKWDSLLNVGNYPTIQHIQPEDKDIILSYRRIEK